MENRKVPALLAVAVLVIAAVVFFAIGDDDTADEAAETTQTSQTAPSTTKTDTGKKERPEKPEKPDEPAVPEIEIKGGEPVGGVAAIEVPVGSELRVNITTDAPDELHLHTYDVYLDIVPGKTNELVVENADIEGVIELESHTTGALIAEISVVPG